MNKFLSYALETFFNFSTNCHYKNVFNIHIYLFIYLRVLIGFILFFVSFVDSMF